MPDGLETKDLRVRKTRQTLMAAMSRLLRKRNFNQITVNDLCEEALVCRSTFYAHFRDKYDLLRCWLANVESEIAGGKTSYEGIEKSVNDFARNNKKTIRHLLANANSETTDLLCDFVLSLLDLPIDRTDRGRMSPPDIVLSNVCCGGMLNYLMWQVNHKFPPDFPVMNRYIFDMLLHFKR